MKIAYTKLEAAEATGLSIDTISRAVNAGELATATPQIDGKPIQKVLILGSEIERWLTNSPRK